MYEDHLYKDLTYKIIGAAFTVHRNLGPVHKVIIEIKATEFLSPDAKNQLSYYLKGTKYKIGLLLNFGVTSLEVNRRIYDKKI